MTTLSSIQSFLSTKELAIAGVSRDPKKFGRQVYEHLKANGYTLYPVNPHVDSLGGEQCFRSIPDLPGQVDRIFIVTPPQETAGIVRQCLDRGIRNFWIQQRSDTAETLEMLRDPNVNLIHNKCIFMFAEPVKGAHAFHRFLSRIFGSYPKK